MRFSQLLVEYDRNQTLGNYGEKLLAAASKDQSIDFQGILAQYGDPEQTNFRIILQRNPEAQQAMINYVMGVIEQADPTKNKSYSQAITRLYCFGQTLLEDIASTLSQYLIKFDKLKRKKKIPAPYNDFMRYKSLDEFMTVVEELPDPDSELEQQKVGALQVPADVQYKLIYGTFDNAMRITSDCVVIVPENQQAGYWWAKEYPKHGVTNRWCTAWEGSNSRFDYYSRQGPLYIIIPARRNDDNEKYQFHFETKQFMDYQDHQIGNQGIDALTQRFPVLMDVFRKQAIEFNVFPLMTAEYKNAIKEYAVTAASQLDSMIEQYRDRIAAFGFNSLGDYGITIPDDVKNSLMEPIGVYLDQTRQALEAKGGFWDKVRESLGSERDENKIEVMLNTDTLLKGAMDSSRAGGLVEQLAREPDIAKRIDPSHLQDLILRDPLFRFVMRQVPKLYKEFLEKLETEAKQGLNESTGLTFMGSPCTKDCSGHQAGYKWSLDRNGRTANGHSQSFNNGTNIAADVSKKRKQGGGKLPGYVSQTKDAIRKRAARAFAKTTLGQDTNLQESQLNELAKPKISKKTGNTFIQFKVPNRLNSMRVNVQQELAKMSKKIDDEAMAFVGVPIADSIIQPNESEMNLHRPVQFTDSNGNPCRAYCTDTESPTGFTVVIAKIKQAPTQGVAEGYHPSDDWQEVDSVKSTNGDTLAVIVKHNAGSYGYYNERKGNLETGFTSPQEARQAFIEYFNARKQGVAEGDVQEHIVKVKGGYELKSKKTGRNLGKYPTRSGAEKRERQVQYFKHMGEALVYPALPPLVAEIVELYNKAKLLPKAAPLRRDTLMTIADLVGGAENVGRAITLATSIQRIHNAGGAGSIKSSKELEELDALHAASTPNFLSNKLEDYRKEFHKLVDICRSLHYSDWQLARSPEYKQLTAIRQKIRQIDDQLEQSIPINEATFNSKQEVIDHFVKQGKSAAAGAAAWERGWRGSKPKAKPAKPQQPQQRYWWQDKEDLDESTEVTYVVYVDGKALTKFTDKNKAIDTYNDLKIKFHDKKIELKTENRAKSMYESRVYYSVIGTPEEQLKSEFSMSKDENGWYLKENVDKRKHANAYRAFGAPKLKEVNLASFSGDAATKGEDNVVSPLTKSIKKK